MAERSASVQPVEASERPGERGSVLMLMPAAVLIMIVLGALAIDRAVVFGAQRDLVATAEAAADDAASAVDEARLRAEGRVDLDPAQIDRAVRLAAAHADGEVTASWEIDGGAVVVRMERRVELIFSPGVPGGPDHQAVRARAEAELHQG